jgi:CHAD domain-containing protein
VIVGLDSQAYARILHDWGAFLDEPLTQNPLEDNATQPIIDLARQRIYKRYRRVIKDGNHIILDQPQDELLHALRIDCKKLRYLIEFFASLFPPKKVTRLVNQLKRLQDNLGDFNDLSVQQAYLLNIAGELPCSDTGARRTLVATGSLVASLARKQDQVKADFSETFTAFASRTNRELFRELFSQKSSGERPAS